MGPFHPTPEDFAEWQDELNGSPATVIEQEAVAVETNPKAWFLDRFITTPEQEAFIVSQDDTLAQYWGASIAFFIRHGLPIELVKPAEKPAVRSSKLILSEEELRQLAPTAARTDADAQLDGILRFIITY